MGRAKALELLCLNKKLTADEAKERNLVAEVVPHQKFRKEVERRLQTFAALPDTTFNLTKRLTRSWDRQILHEVNEKETECLKERFMSPESFDAMLKFFSGKSKI